MKEYEGNGEGNGETARSILAGTWRGDTSVTCARNYDVPMTLWGNAQTS